MPAHLLYHLVAGADRFLSRCQTRLCERRGGLVTIFLHGVFVDRAEIQSGAAYPQQETTPEVLAQMFEYFLAAGYMFITPEKLLEGVNPRKNYAMLTFDDGYFNNTRALPVLERFNAPATIFVSAGHIQTGKPYWWECLYHARRQQQRGESEMAAEFATLNLLKSQDIETRLSSEFGDSFLRSRGDSDRPLTPRELRDLAAHPLISIGNHTYDHDVLTAYSPEEVRCTIRQAQQALEEMTGKTPVSIAYPNGEFNPRIAEIAREEGLKLGFTTVPRKETVSRALSPARRMTLGRFRPDPRQDWRGQYDYFRSDLMLTIRLQALRARLRSNK